MAAPHQIITALAAERQRRGISVAAIARRTGYRAEAIRKWERGSVPGLLAVEDYATALGYQLTLTPISKEP
jgi:transcriptional regulator with XRE-family HTH domain